MLFQIKQFRHRQSETRGSITLVQVAVIMMLGVVFLMAVSGFESGLKNVSKYDACSVEALKKNLDFADPSLFYSTTVNSACGL